MSFSPKFFCTSILDPSFFTGFFIPPFFWIHIFIFIHNLLLHRLSPYCPFPNNTMIAVFNKILKSSQSDQLSIYQMSNFILSFHERAFQPLIWGRDAMPGFTWNLFFQLPNIFPPDAEEQSLDQSKTFRQKVYWWIGVFHRRRTVLKNLPILVIRGSLLATTCPSPIFSAPCTIVLNFHILKILPYCPTLSWRKKYGPGRIQFY